MKYLLNQLIQMRYEVIISHNMLWILHAFLSHFLDVILCKG